MSAVYFWKRHYVLDIAGNHIVNQASTRIEELSKAETRNDISSSTQKGRVPEQDVESIWPMVNGMLTNLGPLSSDVIHRNLSMFIPGFAKTLADVIAVLDALTEKDVLDHDGMGTYKIK